MKKNKFTFIELIIVIVIIVIFANISFPILSGIQAKAKAIQCAGNLKQLGSYWNSYLDHFDGLTPIDSFGPSYPYWTVSFGKIIEWKPGTIPEILNCPAYEMKSSAPFKSGQQATLQVNAHMLSGRKGQDDKESKIRPYLQIQPERIISMIDGNPGRAQGRICRTQDVKATMFRHDGQANVLYWDGHVSTLNSSVMGTAKLPTVWNQFDKYPWSDGKTYTKW